jgi:malate dehydrogenase (oxaloacetate-decarboxylating)(NADP+)
LAKKPVPEIVNKVYHVSKLIFGRDYFIPKPVDPRLLTEVSAAVAKAAIESGVARKTITDWDAYKEHLLEFMGRESKLTQHIFDAARTAPQRVVFAEGTHPSMMKAAIKAKEAAMRKVQEDLDRIKKPIERKTFSEVYNEYVEKERNGKAYQTFGNG